MNSFMIITIIAAALCMSNAAIPTWAATNMVGRDLITTKGTVKETEPEAAELGLKTIDKLRHGDLEGAVDQVSYDVGRIADTGAKRAGEYIENTAVGLADASTVSKLI